MTSSRIDVVTGIVRAWRRHDIDAVVASLDPDILWHYHVGSPPVQGSASVRRTLDRLVTHQLEVAWQLVRVAETDDAILVEGTDDFRNPSGVHVRVPYMGVFEFANEPGEPDGHLVTGWRDYVDMAIMRSAGAGEPLEAWLTDLVDRPGIVD